MRAAGVKHHLLTRAMCFHVMALSHALHDAVCVTAPDETLNFLRPKELHQPAVCKNVHVVGVLDLLARPANHLAGCLRSVTVHRKLHYARTLRTPSTLQTLDNPMKAETPPMNTLNLAPEKRRSASLDSHCSVTAAGRAVTPGPGIVSLILSKSCSSKGGLAGNL